MYSLVFENDNDISSFRFSKRIVFTHSDCLPVFTPQKSDRYTWTPLVSWSIWSRERTQTLDIREPKNGSSTPVYPSYYFPSTFLVPVQISWGNLRTPIDGSWTPKDSRNISRGGQYVFRTPDVTVSRTMTRTTTLTKTLKSQTKTA